MSNVCLCVCLSGSHTFLVVTHSYVSQATHAFLGMLPLFLCCRRSIAAHRDHFVWCLSVHESVCPRVCLSCSHTFLLVVHSYASQGTHAFLGMLPLFSRKCVIDHPVIGKRSSAFQIRQPIRYRETADVNTLLVMRSILCNIQALLKIAVKLEFRSGSNVMSQSGVLFQSM